MATAVSGLSAVVKTYSAFSMSEALLGKVTEAVKQGERDARRYSQLRSFEIFYQGHRQNLVLGRIMIIPAKLADSIEDFPSALLYGAMVKELKAESIAEMLSFKIGDSEYDEYDKKDLAAIKEKLFTDPEGTLRSIVMFIPTWAAPRDYVMFKFTRDDERLAMLIRHMIYGVYFEPALSSAFDLLATDFAQTKVDVVDITPKFNHPFLAENILKQYPELEPGDEGDKTASVKRRPKMILAKGTLGEFKQELMQPGERAVFDQLTKELTRKVNGEIDTPEEASKQAGVKTSAAPEGPAKPYAQGGCLRCGKTVERGPDGVWRHGDGKRGKIYCDVDKPYSDTAAPKKQAAVSKRAAILPLNRVKEDSEQAECGERWGHEWAPWRFTNWEDFIREGYPTHMCQRCLMPGRDESVSIEDLKNSLPKFNDIPQAERDRLFKQQFPDHKAKVGARTDSITDFITGEFKDDGFWIYPKTPQDLKALQAKGVSFPTPGAYRLTPEQKELVYPRSRYGDAPNKQAAEEAPVVDETKLPRPGPDAPLPWQAKHPEYHPCSLCNKDGLQHQRGERRKNRCSECSGQGWVYDPDRKKGLKGVLTRPTGPSQTPNYDGPERRGPGTSSPAAPPSPYTKTRLSSKRGAAAPAFEERYRGLTIDALKEAEATLAGHISQDEGKAIHPTQKERHEETKAELDYVRSQMDPNAAKMAAKKQAIGETAVTPQVTATVRIEWGGKIDTSELTLNWYRGRCKWTDELGRTPQEAPDLCAQVGESSSVEEAKRKLEERVFAIGEMATSIKYGDGEIKAKRNLKQATGEIDDDHPETEEPSAVAQAATALPTMLEALPEIAAMIASAKQAKIVKMVAQVLGGYNWKLIDKSVMAKPKIVAAGSAITEQDAHQQADAKLASLGGSVPAAVIPEGRLAKVVLRTARAVLVRSGSSLVAKTATGYSETIRVNGNQVRWTQPNQFSPDFRRAADLYVRNPRNHSRDLRKPLAAAKQADVPQTFDEIWSDKMEDMGPAPQVKLKDEGHRSHPVGEGSGAAPEEAKAEAPAETKAEPKSETKPDKEAPHKKTDYGAKLDKLRERRDPEGKETDKPWSKEKKESKDEDAAFGKQGGTKQNKLVLGKCNLCHTAVDRKTGSEIGPDTFQHAACKDKLAREQQLNFIPRQVLAAFYPEVLKVATFNMFHPGPVLNEFDPGLLHETVDHPESTYNPLISDVGPGPEGAYVPTSPAGGIGIGRDGKPQVLDGAPLRKENDIRGYAFADEFYSQTEPIDSTLLTVASVHKRADAAAFKAQFSDFVKKAMGEVAASFIAAFKITQRSLMDKIPGVGAIQLEKVEQPINSSYNLQNVASRVRYLVSKLNDGDIQEAINDGWAQASVWNTSELGGFVYEVFVRPESLDQDSLVLNYSFVVGTKGM